MSLHLEDDKVKRKRKKNMRGEKDHSTKLGNSFTNLDLTDVTTSHIWPQRRLCAAGGLSEMKGCNPQLKYVVRPVLSMRRWIGFSLPANAPEGAAVSVGCEPCILQL